MDLSKNLKRIVYENTTSKEAFDFYTNLFKEYDRKQVQDILDHWHRQRYITKKQRNVLREEFI